MLAAAGRLREDEKALHTCDENSRACVRCTYFRAARPPTSLRWHAAVDQLAETTVVRPTYPEPAAGLAQIELTVQRLQPGIVFELRDHGGCVEAEEVVALVVPVASLDLLAARAFHVALRRVGASRNLHGARTEQGSAAR